jgi:ribosomal protein S18 acetylase RimI-like enzyme
MHVALLKSSDAVQYRQLMLEAYELAADAFTSTPEDRAKEPESYWTNRIADPSGLSAAFGAFNGQVLLGTVALELSAKPKTRHKALVIGMYVAPAMRGTGAGRALMTALVDYALAKEELRMLTLTVTEGNEPAVRLYRRFGFEQFGAEPMAILTPSGYKSKIHMWLPLRRDTTAA